MRRQTDTFLSRIAYVAYVARHLPISLTALRQRTASDVYRTSDKHFDIITCSIVSACRFGISDGNSCSSQVRVPKLSIRRKTVASHSVPAAPRPGGDLKGCFLIVDTEQYRRSGKSSS